MYGAKCSSKQLQVAKAALIKWHRANYRQELPRIIVILNLLPIMLLALVTGQYLALSLWLPTCFAVRAQRSDKMMQNRISLNIDYIDKR